METENWSVLDDYIIIELPYEVINPTKADENFATVIYDGIFAIWQYVNSHDSSFHRNYKNQYPSQEHLMYEDLLAFINQYMRTEIEFLDLMYITKRSISKGFYHAVLFSSFVIDIEFEEQLSEEETED